MQINKRLIYFVGLFLIVCLILFSTEKRGWAGTTGKIAGVVVDDATKEPQPGANVMIVGTTMGAAADMEGRYYILNVPPGVYSVRVTMMGYTTLVKEQVRVNADRTTTLNFDIKTTVLDVAEEVVVTAERPLVELDVSGSQTITTVEQAAALPAAQIIQTLQYEPGVQIDNLEELRIRGGGSDQLSFQVDGMERMDRLNTRAYTEMNSVTISEVQILSGGFNAEYGNIRSGIINVITREGAPKLFGSMDYNLTPAAEKHFGPNAYGDDQYDNWLYGRPESMNPIVDVEGKEIWMGWKKRTETLNAANYMGKNDWTPEEIIEVWRWQTRARDYAHKADQNLNAGFGGPLQFLEELGLKEAGFFAGYKFNRYLPPFAILTEYFQSDTKELKVSFKPISSIKVVLNGMYGKTRTTTDGNSWQGNDWAMSLYHAGEDLAAKASEYGSNKYYVSADCILDLWTRQFGAKIIHTLSPSTYYELRYNRFWIDSEVGRGPARSPRTIGIKNVAGVWFDEAPFGWVDEADRTTDLTGAYLMGGAGRVKDTSNVVTHKINLDMTSQINANHLVKAGFELELSHLIRKYERVEEKQFLYGEWVEFDEEPFRIAGYVQDKLEYGGMIANVGLRLDYFAAKGKIWEPDNVYSTLYVRGGTLGYESPDAVPSGDSESYLFVSPRLGIAHPVRENTKFFFNYGVFYSEPQNAVRFGHYSEHRPFGDPEGDIRWVGYPSLKPPKTSAYEVGFEQSLWDTYLIRAAFYAKDAEDQVGDLRVDGSSGSHNYGEFLNYISVGKGAAGYNTPRNNEYEDIRGIEFKLSKLRGRYFTGWLYYDYKISTKGYYGTRQMNQDPLVGYYIYSAVQQRAQPVPSFVANLDFHTPGDWGMLTGDWRLSVIQTWSMGQKLIYNPENLPTREVRTIYYYVDRYNTNLRLTKSLQLGDQKFHLYMDVNNLFNQKYLNTSVIPFDTYITDVVDTESGLRRKVGEYKDKDGNNVFTENWVDKNGTKRAPLAPNNDFALFLYPRSFLFGVRYEF